jgi:hypothetical protein
MPQSLRHLGALDSWVWSGLGMHGNVHGGVHACAAEARNGGGGHMTMVGVATSPSQAHHLSYWSLEGA